MIRICEIAENCMAELLNYMLVLGAQLLLLAGFTAGEPEVGRLLLQAAIPLFYYFLREKCNSIPLFFFLHVIPVGVSYFLLGTGISEKIILTLGALVLAVLSISRRMFSEERGMRAANPIVTMGLLLVFYLFDMAQMGGNVGGYLFRMAVFFSVGYFLYYYFNRAIAFLKISNMYIEGVPVKKVLFTAFGMVSGFSAAAFVVINLITNREWLDWISRWISRMLHSLLSAAVIHVPETENPVEDFSFAKMEYDYLGTSSEASEWTVILDVILKTAGSLLFLAFLIFLVAAAFRLLGKAFGMKKKQETLRDVTEEDRIEKLDKREKKKSGTREWKLFGSTPEQKIRKLYYKTMMKKYSILKEEKTKKLLTKGTARECCRTMFGDEGAQAEQFVHIYEKARYGAEDCSAADVKKMKEYAEGMTR